MKSSLIPDAPSSSIVYSMTSTLATGTGRAGYQLVLSGFLQDISQFSRFSLIEGSEGMCRDVVYGVFQLSSVSLIEVSEGMRQGFLDFSPGSRHFGVV